MASIREVAKLAGVSPATVSRVINGTANVDDEKKQRVLKVINETGFRPNELARALFKQSSKIIGVIVPNIENPFFSELSKAIEEEAYENGYKMLLCNSNNNEEKELMNIQMLNQLKADGLIMVTDSNNTIKNLEDNGFPVVLVDRKLSKINEIAIVESDNYSGGKIATKHLIAPVKLHKTFNRMWLQKYSLYERSTKYFECKTKIFRISRYMQRIWD